MLSKKERLNREEFNRFFAIGKRVQSATFTMVYSPHTKFHASVVVSKKIFKTAVQRNALRRRVYAILEHHSRNEGRRGVFILIAKPPVKELKKYDILKQEVEALLGRIAVSR